MRIFIVTIFALTLGSVNAQSDDQFSVVAMQGKDTVQIGHGLRNYEPIRLSWINKSTEKLKTVEVHFGNASLPFAKRNYKIAKGQKLVIIDLQEFLALDTRDIESPRKREAEFSRIVIVCVMESTKYKSYAIPFKVPEDN